jgi:Zn-dependent protease with chaperone function
MPLVWTSAAVSVVAIAAWAALVVWLVTVPSPTGLAGDVRDFFVGDGATTGAQILLTVPLLPLILWGARALLYAKMRASAVQMSPTQFPEGYRMVVEAAERFGLRRVPDAYVLLGNGKVNAFAAGHGFRRFVVIHSDLFEVGGSARDPEALRFIISHEVGHLAAGHVSFWRLLVSQAASSVPLLGKALSRAQEYTADNHGYDVSPTGVPGVVGLLGAGKYLGAQVGLHATADRAAHERGFWVHIVQWTSTHPILTWRAHALRDRSRPGRLMMRPKTAWYPPVSPAGGVGSEAWPTPADVLARMDRSAPRVPGAEEQFGRYPGMFYAVGRDELRLSDPTPLFTPPDAAGRPAHPRT